MKTEMIMEIVQKPAVTPPLVCDRCGRQMPKGSGEYDEAVIVSFRAGYFSVFVDDEWVRGCFCQHCIKDRLGEWLTVCEAQGPAQPCKAYQPSQKRPWPSGQ